ncbi:hypothetical protein OROGR_022003 [Orobanche gracilis]
MEINGSTFLGGHHLRIHGRAGRNCLPATVVAIYGLVGVGFYFPTTCGVLWSGQILIFPANLHGCGRGGTRAVRNSGSPGELTGRELRRRAVSHGFSEEVLDGLDMSFRRYEPPYFPSKDMFDVNYGLIGGVPSSSRNRRLLFFGEFEVPRSEKEFRTSLLLGSIFFSCCIASPR